MALPLRFRFWTGVYGLLLPRMRLIKRVRPLWLRRWLAEHRRLMRRLRSKWTAADIKRWLGVTE